MSYEALGLIVAKLSWVDPASFVAMDFGHMSSLF